MEWWIGRRKELREANVNSFLFLKKVFSYSFLVFAVDNTEKIITSYVFFYLVFFLFMQER